MESKQRIDSPIKHCDRYYSSSSVYIFAHYVHSIHFWSFNFPLNAINKHEIFK